VFFGLFLQTLNTAFVVICLKKTRNLLDSGAFAV